MDLLVSHNKTTHSFESMVDGYNCLLNYSLHNKIMKVMHVEVPEAVSGRGIAKGLTQVALSVAGNAGWKVVPVCAFSVAYLRKRPELAYLLV